MLMTSFGRTWGDTAATVTPTAAESAQVPVFVSSGQRIAALETRLRNAFGQITVTTSMLGSTPIPDSLLALMGTYNNAQSAFMQTVNIWLLARQQTPKDQLPDPDAQPTSIPTFTLPTATATASGFGAPILASDIMINAGPIGKEKSIPLGDYIASGAFAAHMNGPTGLGFPVVALLWLLGIAVVGACVVLAIRLSQSASVAASEAQIALAEARVAEAELLTKAAADSRDTCIKGGGDPVACTTAAANAVKLIQEGLPSTPSSTGFGFLATLGVLTVVGALGAVGYVAYRRNRGSQKSHSTSSKSSRYHREA